METEVTSITDTLLSDEIVEKFGFTIKTISLENMAPPKKVIVKVQLNGKTLGKSEEIVVENREAELNWEIFFEIKENLSGSELDELATHPFVFTVLCEDILPLEEKPIKNKKGDKDKNKKLKTPSEKEKPSKERSISNTSKKSKKSVISKSTTSSNSEPYPVLGVANLDIMSLLLGEVEHEEILVIYPTAELKGSLVTAWANLPKLNVSVSAQGDILGQISENFSNVLYFTLESLQNFTPVFTENVQVATILPSNQGFHITEPYVGQVIKFTNGSLLTDDSTWVSKRKKWHGLRDLQGQGALSSYNVSENILDLMNTTDYKVSNEALCSNPRIQWNQLYRSFLNADSEKTFKDKLIGYNCWPVEILLSSSEKETKHKEKRNKSEGFDAEKTNHFITFLDLSKLIYPGETSVRLTSQLFSYTEESFKKCFGSYHVMFEETAVLPDIQDVKPKTASPKTTTAKKEKEKESAKSKKGSIKSKKGSIKRKSEKIEEEVTDDELIPQKEPEPLFNDDGEPVFIVVQFELLKPLVKKRDPDEMLESIHKLIPPRLGPTPGQVASMDVMKMFENCIKSLTHNIHDEYQIFYNRNETFEKSSKNFLMHLHVTGAYSKMMESIKESAEGYIGEVVGSDTDWSTLKFDSQELLTGIYHQMVRKMCAVVNSLSNANVDKYEPGLTCDGLHYFAVEAMEEDAFDKAQEYLLQRLEKSEKSDPQLWVDYAKFWKNKLEFEKAEECVKEAIALDARHINALLFHGLLSWLTEDFYVAEMFLLAVVTFNPFSLESWVALHILHKQMNKQQEAGVELSQAKNCVGEGLSLTEVHSNALLSWCACMADSDRIFLVTASKLLSFSFPELAELALSYDLLIYGKTTSYLYYLAVCHYYQGRYVDSLQHLEEALTMDWENDKIWALKGHNLYKLQKIMESKEAFNVALNFRDQEDTHLINLRLGNMLLCEGDHKEARLYFTVISKKSPTPLSWLGLGIAAFMDDDIEDAELALSEANMLDSRMGKIWGYLALVNLMMIRPHLFNKCIAQAFKYGLDDPVLLERINVLEKLVQPTNI